MKLHKAHPDYFMFWCPGCNTSHALNARWEILGDDDNLTINPSILSIGETSPRCHSFVRNGQIEFLDDCDHKLAGKTVPMVDWDEYVNSDYTHKYKRDDKQDE